MTDKELHKLSRADLLELLLEQSREVERLEAELKEVREQLESRRIIEQKAGSIAKASLQLNGVFEAAQMAADQYVENVRIQAAAVMRRLDVAKQKEADMKAHCKEMEAETQAKCDRMVREAQDQADTYWRNARCQLERYRGSSDFLPGAFNQSGEEQP